MNDQQMPLWGQHRPPIGVRIDVDELEPGVGGDLSICVQVRYHAPKPDVFEVAKLPSEARGALEGIVSDFLRAWRRGDAGKGLVGFLAGIERAKAEYTR